MRYPDHLLSLIQVLKRFPGVGTKSAERFAFHLLNWSDEHLKELSEYVGSIKKKLAYCSECGCLTGEEGCSFCLDHHRETDILCIIASAKDVFAIEGTREYRGLYHVLGSLLSPLDRRGPEHLSLAKLEKRLLDHKIKEVVIALDSTLEGDTTSLHIKQLLAKHDLHISRLAFGLPMGSSFDYVDGGTLARALSARGKF